MKTAAAIILLLGVVLGAQARIYERCELVRELRRFPFFNNQMADWVCLVEHESLSNSGAVGGPNTDGSYDYGLFQINNRYWCGMDGPGGGCNIRCDSLLSDDGVGAAANCVQLIFNQMGLEAWNAWKAYCRGQPLPDVSGC